MLRAGIVGLPNVGKSTLFNALTRTRKAESANYPFCTIDPNVGVVMVPDAGLPLAAIEDSAEIIPAAVEFVDIAGLVAGASQGEGMGNKFLSHIREVDAVVQVVRCFEDSEIHHVAGSVDPVRDIETITTELILADLDSLRRQMPKLEKDAKRGDKEAAAKFEFAQKLEPHLDAGKPAITFELEETNGQSPNPCSCSPPSQPSLPPMFRTAIWPRPTATRMWKPCAPTALNTTAAKQWSSALKLKGAGRPR